MDALMFKGNWQHKGGSLDLVDGMQAIAKKIVPDWKKYWVTKTHWQGSNTRLVTPLPHPVVKYGPGKAEVYNIGSEIEGHPGVFPLTYKEGVPDELRKAVPKEA